MTMRSPGGRLGTKSDTVHAPYTQPAQKSMGKLMMSSLKAMSHSRNNSINKNRQERARNPRRRQLIEDAIKLRKHNSISPVRKTTSQREPRRQQPQQQQQQRSTRPEFVLKRSKSMGRMYRQSSSSSSSPAAFDKPVSNRSMNSNSNSKSSIGSNSTAPNSSYERRLLATVGTRTPSTSTNSTTSSSGNNNNNNNNNVVNNTSNHSNNSSNNNGSIRRTRMNPSRAARVSPSPSTRRTTVTTPTKPASARVRASPAVVVELDSDDEVRTSTRRISSIHRSHSTMSPNSSSRPQRRRRASSPSSRRNRAATSLSPMRNSSGVTPQPRQTTPPVVEVVRVAAAPPSPAPKKRSVVVVNQREKEERGGDSAVAVVAAATTTTTTTTTDAVESKLTGLELAQHYYNKGSDLAQEHNYEQAIVAFKHSVMVRDPIVGQYDLDIASLYWNIGNCYFALQQYDKALMSHHRWLRIRRRLNDDVNKPTISWIFAPLQKKGLSDEQIQEYDDTLKKSLFREMEGDELRGKKELEAAIVKYKESIEIEKRCFQIVSLSTATEDDTAAAAVETEKQ